MSKNFVEVIPVGTPVVVGNEIPAIIQQVCITANNRVQYQCNWWNGRSRSSEWLEEFEVRIAAKSPSQIIGFCAEPREGVDYVLVRESERAT